MLFRSIALIPIGIVLLFVGQTWAGLILLAFGVVGVVKEFGVERYGLVEREKDEETSTNLQQRMQSFALWVLKYAEVIIVVIGVVWLLAKYWLPLGAAKSLTTNVLFVSLLVIIVLGFFILLEYYYKTILRWSLNHKMTFLLIPTFLILFGVTTWMGFNNMFGFVAKGFDTVGVNIRTTKVWSGLTHTFPAIGKEFMPSLNEGSFLLMPTSMPHSGFEYNRKVLGQLDMLLTNIPEVELTVGKLGRAESALDPAPISMYENVINYHPEYMLNENGRRVRFKVDRNDRFILNSGDTLTNEEALHRGVAYEELILDRRGKYYRNWRPEIKSPDDIWNEIVRVARIPGVTSAPKLQPIETRLVMLQTGMRAPMGIKVYGPDLATIEAFGLELEEDRKSVV